MPKSVRAEDSLAEDSLGQDSLVRKLGGVSWTPTPRLGAPLQVDSYEPTKLQALAKRLNMTLSNNREHMTDLEEAVHNASFDTKPVDSAISVDDSADGMAAAAPAVQQPQPAPQAAPQPVPQAAPQPAQQTAPQQPAQARAQQQAPQPAQLPQPAQPDARLEPSDRRGITEMVTSAVTSVVSTSLAGSEQRMGGKIDKLASNMVSQNRQLRGELKETQTQVSALNRKYKLLLARFRSLRQKGSVPAGRNASPPYSPIASDLEDEGAASSGEVDAMEVSEAQAVQEQAAAQELQANAMQLEQQQAAAQALQPVPAPVMQQQQQQVPPPPPPRAPQQGSPMGNVGSGAGRYQGDYRGAVMGTQQPNPAVKRALMKDLVRGHSDERNVQGMPLTRMPPEGAFDSVRGHVVNELSPEATRAMDVQNGDLLDGAKDCDRPLYDHLLQHPQLAAMGAAAWMHLPLVPADPPMYGSGPYGTRRDEDGAWQQTPSRSGGYHPGNQQKKGRWSGAKRGGQQGGQQGGWRQGGGDPGAGPSGQQQCRWCKQPGFTPAHLIDCNAYKDHLRRQSGK